MQVVDKKGSEGKAAKAATMAKGAAEGGARGAADAKAKVRDLAGAGVDAQEAALAPEAEGAAMEKGLGLGESTEELFANPAIKVVDVAKYVGAKGLPALVGKQLMAGIKAEAVMPIDTLEQALSEYVDQGELTVSTVTTSRGTFSWIRFYAGDTEVGYLFKPGTATPVGLVSDGWITQM